MKQISKEELGYIVFSMKKEDEYDLILERIKTFRSLPQEQMEAEIEAFKNTEIGKLTLVKAPNTNYYIGLCIGTGICDRKGNELFIKANKEDEAKIILERFKGVKPFDFGDNLHLWIDYFGNVDQIRPPLLVNVTLKKLTNTYIRILDVNGTETERGVISEERPQLSVPLFKDEEYKFEFYSFLDAKKIFEQNVKIDQDKISFDIQIGKGMKTLWNFDATVQKINDLISSKDFDIEYKHHINIVKKIDSGKNFNISQLRGGRLEYLFYRLFNFLKDQGIIDDVVWNGRLDDYNLAYPAPGGKEGLPDIYFFIGNSVLALELTTIRAGAMQWSAEGASVHDHIMNLSRKFGGNYEVIGLFSAPTISSRVNTMFQHISSREGTLHRTIPINDLIDIFSKNQEEIKNILGLKQQ